ncbi:MAG: hypothetical protein IPH75_05180 [bacterium]|nr:hypothetical protein [bacterium]
MHRWSIFPLFLVVGLAALCLLVACPKKPHDITGNDNDDPDPVDTVKPSVIADLHLDTFGIARATVCWSAPGDDGDSGTATAYDMRMSHDSLTTANFDSASLVWVGNPIEAGEEQCVELLSLDGELSYYVALRARDEANNWSDLSDCIRVQCLIDSIVYFPDSMLEQAVRLAIQRPDGPIRRSYLESLRSVTSANSGVSDLTGLQYCPRLADLTIPGNAITTLEPLRHLDSLRTLIVYSNQLTSLEPLEGHTELTWLDIGYNPLSDLAPLASMTSLTNLTMYQLPLDDFTVLQSLTNLERLGMAHNDVSDLSVLAGATKLSALVLVNCNLSDITVLKDLPSLSSLSLAANLIVDIRPLVDNSGIGDGDEVSLTGNPLSDSSKSVHIPALQSRGVTVTW